MALLRFLLIVFAGYLLFRVIGRYVLPWLGKKVVEKAQDNMAEQMERRHSGEKVYESGDITIRKTTAKRDLTRKNGNEDYVDYEEVE